MILEVFLVLYLLFFLVSFIFIALNWSFIFYKDKKSKPSIDKGVSVIVCAKNEQDNIPVLLNSLKNQDYSNFEIVLVNDSSSDSTLDLFEEFASNNENVEVVDVHENERFWRGKKFALTLGIKRASNDYLIFTDADCVPKSSSWISSVMSTYSDNTDVVLGYGPYSKTKGFLNKFIRFETIQTASNYFSYALTLKPYMGVGRNLSYKKDLFFANNGFYKHMNVASGDDDLFVNENASKRNTKIVFSEDSRVESKAEESLKSLLKQKRRHYSTSQHYSFGTKFLLGLQVFSKLMFYSLFFLLIALQFNVEIVLSAFALYFVINFTTFTILSKKLNEKDLIPFLGVFDFLFVYFQLFIQLSNVISYPKRWA